MDIAVIGSNHVDLISYFDQMPSGGKTVGAPDSVTRRGTRTPCATAGQLFRRRRAAGLGDPVGSGRPATAGGEQR